MPVRPLRLRADLAGPVVSRAEAHPGDSAEQREAEVVMIASMWAESGHRARPVVR